MNLNPYTIRGLALLFAAGFTATASADGTDRQPDTDEPTVTESPALPDGVGLDMENVLLPIADDRGF
ncbi:MAG: hypothetical protein IJ729_02145, partial [Alloprevotella sp.]|nr:hypothetical protein [Alloprevotella sp.]